MVTPCTVIETSESEKERGIRKKELRNSGTYFDKHIIPPG